MKARKMYVVLLIALIAAISLTAVACKEKIKTPGPESGAYYYDASDGSEYTLELHDGDKIKLVMKGETKEGKYTLKDTKLTITFKDE
ncbi:MAG: hypothetical protein J1F36_06895, partial [Clostridiales bacterium]|nr:hypothetical protein [Clostridiales bacterium]